MTKSATRVAADGELFKSTGIDDNATSTAVTIDASENVGFGTVSPSALIDAVTNTNDYVAKFIQSNTSNGDGVQIIVGSTASADYALTVRSDAGNTSGLAVKADGKVGIGTFVPSKPLDVSGDIRTSTGILFGTDTAAANTLDDYEEGEYSYTITGSTGGSMTPKVNYTKFSYTKIGSMVHVQGKFETSGAHNATGVLEFSLPFTSANLTDQAGSAAGALFLYRAGLANVYNPTIFVPDNYTTFLVYYNNISNNEVTTLDGGNVDSTIEGFVSVTYRAA
jgi:hypothetical protein